MFSILKSKQGETLVESIVSFALITLALLGFTAMVTLGMQLNARALQTDSSAGSVAQADTQAQVTISSGSASSTYDVVLTKNQDGTVSGYEPASAKRTK